MWSTLMELNPTLAEKCIDAVLEETVCYNEWELKRRPLVEAFASTCTPALEHSFIHPLLKLLDLFDDYAKEYVGEATKLQTLFANNADAAFLHKGVTEKLGTSVEAFASIIAFVQDIKV